MQRCCMGGIRLCQTLAPNITYLHKFIKNTMLTAKSMVSALEMLQNMEYTNWLKRDTGIVTLLKKKSFEMTFKTFSVKQFWNGWRKTVPSRWCSKGKATLAKFQSCSQLLVVETAGGPKSCKLGEVSWSSETVSQIWWHPIDVDKMH